MAPVPWAGRRLIAQVVDGRVMQSHAYKQSHHGELKQGKPKSAAWKYKDGVISYKNIDL